MTECKAMEEFENFILARKLITQKKSSYYQNWILKFFSFHNLQQTATQTIDSQLVNSYISHLEKNFKSWQVTQAEEALRLYIFYLSKQDHSKKAALTFATSQSMENCCWRNDKSFALKTSRNEYWKNIQILVKTISRLYTGKATSPNRCSKHTKFHEFSCGWTKCGR